MTFRNQEEISSASEEYCQYLQPAGSFLYCHSSEVENWNECVGPLLSPPSTLLSSPETILTPPDSLSDCGSASDYPDMSHLEITSQCAPGWPEDWRPASTAEYTSMDCASTQGWQPYGTPVSAQDPFTMDAAASLSFPYSTVDQGLSPVLSSNSFGTQTLSSPAEPEAGVPTSNLESYLTANAHWNSYGQFGHHACSDPRMPCYRHEFESQMSTQNAFPGECTTSSKHAMFPGAPSVETVTSDDSMASGRRFTRILPKNKEVSTMEQNGLKRRLQSMQSSHDPRTHGSGVSKLASQPREMAPAVPHSTSSGYSPAMADSLSYAMQESSSSQPLYGPSVGAAPLFPSLQDTTAEFFDDFIQLPDEEGTQLPITSEGPFPLQGDQPLGPYPFQRAPPPPGFSAATEIRNLVHTRKDQQENVALQPSNNVPTVASDNEEGRDRTHPWYSREPEKDGLYHCPLEIAGKCGHKPVKLKCNYDKYIDSHKKPFRCKISRCAKMVFSSTACRLRHEREAHGMHGHGEKPNLCIYQDCDRGTEGNGFPRRYNLHDHMRRVHGHEQDSPGSDSKKNVRAGRAKKDAARRKRPADEPIPQQPVSQKLKMEALPLSPPQTAQMDSGFPQDPAYPVSSYAQQQPVYRNHEVQGLSAAPWDHPGQPLPKQMAFIQSPGRVTGFQDSQGFRRVSG